MPVSETISLWKRLIWSAGIALMFGAFGGCQRQAYTDFYTESMAGEVRELENRIYEYDAAYQSIEQELSILEAENAELHSRLMHLESSPAKRSSSGSILNGSSSSKSHLSEPPPIYSTSPPKYEESAPIQVTPNEIPSVDNLPPPRTSKSAEPTPAPKRESSPSPGSASPSKSKPSSDPNELIPPKIEFGTPSSGKGGFSSPPSETLPKLNTPPSGITLPPSSPPSGTNPSSPGNNAPPSILPLPSQGSSTKAKTAADETSLLVGGLPITPDDTPASNARIELPVGVVTAGFQAKKKAVSKQSIDQKVVEIAFHPSLCRGQNLDDEEGDDGLYLVIQPRNQAGEILDQPAAVTIVAMDPKRPEAEARIGRWTISKDELESSLEPIGLSHGFHLSLPWQNDAEPQGDVVQVYVRFEMEDGRRLINERRIQLHRVAVGSNVWMPRVGR